MQQQRSGSRAGTGTPWRRVALPGGLPVLLLAASLATGAQAAHPLLTEDTGTQGAGKFELEIGVERTREGDARQWEVGPQFSIGVIDTLDLIVRPTWVRFSSDGATARGAGDAAVDFKWRFHEADGLSVGTRTGVDLPVGNADRGLGRGRTAWHTTLIVTYDAEPWTWSANLGYVRQSVDGERRDLPSASLAVLWKVRDGVRLSLDVGAERAAGVDERRWPAVARAGMILTLDEHWDVDVGYQARLGRVGPESVWLAGATLRW